MSETAPVENCSSQSTNICYHSKRITFLSILFSSIATLVVWILLFQSSLTSGFFTYLGIKNEYFLQHPHAQMDALTLHNIGELVSSGTLLSLDDLWSFQGTFYQTIITVLIALNAILGGFAFFMVKQSSNAKAREEAILEVKNYIESKSFDREVKEITNVKVESTINQKIGALQLDLTSQIDSIGGLISEIEGLRKKDEKINQLELECEEMKRHISVLAFEISRRDASENDGSSLILEQGN
ncbi:hydrolase [Erwinia sp. S59]|uniref:hydrolase n=1 Tax=Erwinia sp. S59 TaxID=2769340 RepID=UPI00190CF3C4|nr:hydrolase [Erwinia sp. S59]MBK0091359.1 hydrolase [Erwinia sp. S59]